MSLITSLFGNRKDQRLMCLFLELTSKVRSSTDCLNQLLNNYHDNDQFQNCCFKIQALENEGDELVKQIVELLSEISITSWITYEMVLRLVHVLDEILDNSQSIVRLSENYRLSKVCNEMMLISGVIEQGGKELETTMNLLCRADWHKNTKQLIHQIKKIRQLEHQGDLLKSQGLRELLNCDMQEPLTMHDLAEFRSSEKMLETLEIITDDIHHMSTIVQQCLND